MTSPRRYRSELREEQARRTREAIAREARRAFLEAGWAGTSVRTVAAAAGVSEATVYNVYGSKAGLATSLIDASEQHADVQRAVTELRERTGDPRGQLAAFVAFDRRLYESAGDVLRVLAEGRRQHPELGEAYDEGRRRGSEQRRRVFAEWPATAWRSGVDVERAVVAYAMVVSPWAYDVGVGESGWDPAEVERFWTETLTERLLR